MKKIFTLILILLSTAALAEQGKLYKWVDKNGEVVYSDKPLDAKAEEITPPALQSTRPVKEKPKAAAAKDKDKKPAFVYSDILITQPAMDENIHDNEGKVSIAVEVKPAFFSTLGHTINIKLDGETVVSKSKVLSASLDNLDRGTHTLIAEVCDETGKVLKTSKGVQFHIHRVSRLHPKPNAPKPPAPAP